MLENHPSISLDGSQKLAKHNEDIANNFLIVASASVAGVKTILSFNRKTMASDKMIEVYNKVNKIKGYRTPTFIKTVDGLRELL